MLLSATTSPAQTHTSNLLFFSDSHKLFHTFSTSTHSHRPSLALTTCASSSSSSSLANGTFGHSLQNPSPETLHHLYHTCVDEPEGGNVTVPSASAIAAAIREASTSPVEFVQRIEKNGKNKGLLLPSSDFQRLCLEQLDLFRRIVDPDALLSVYVRPAGSYVMDRLELRRVTSSLGVDSSDIVILVGNFKVPTGLRVAEASLSNIQVEFIPERRVLVFPMVKHPFVVGFLVAELPKTELKVEGEDRKPFPLPEDSFSSPPSTNKVPWQFQTVEGKSFEMFRFTAEQRLNAINVTCSLAMAYVMDQKALLLQQSSWQNNVRMSNLVEQIRGPLSSIQTLSKMLSVHLKRSEISYDIIEDILVQGDHIKDTLEQLQDAVYLTKANIMRYNEETLEKMRHSAYVHPETEKSPLSRDFSSETSTSKVQASGGSLSPNWDSEMPMPPLALAPIRQEGVRPCIISDVLVDLIGAVEPLARMQQRVVELRELSQSLQVAVEEPALRQALSNLIEGALLRTQVGGKVEIASTSAPAGGGALVIIEDDGPDMHYMTQMHSLTPFGMDLLSKGMVEDNMTWNFIAGLTVAREILESYGCVVRVISPRAMESALGTGGTRVELWLPTSNDPPPQEEV